MENPKYLSEQLITYIGNKRTLLPFIGESIETIKKNLGKDKLITFDGFAGSGVVSRFLKQHSSKLYSNDLEKYSHLITKCFLINESTIDRKYIDETTGYLNSKKLLNRSPGIIETLYAPNDTQNPQDGERCFYTKENAKIIDNLRFLIDLISDPKYREIFLSLLIQKASVHTNTSGVFKGFYKSKDTGIGKFGGDGENALSRIKGEINLEPIILSNYECESEVFNKDTNQVVKSLGDLDVAYFDPPYNQHPYGSNYHMLNTIYENVEPKKISKVSGIRDDWNKSEYNKRVNAENAMRDLIENTQAKYILVSYNNEGIISNNSMTEILGQYGNVELKTRTYNTFRGSRNLKERENKVIEQLYVLKKN
jgi:adenine-specific DNA-methyltransferase